MVIFLLEQNDTIGRQICQKLCGSHKDSNTGAAKQFVDRTLFQDQISAYVLRERIGDVSEFLRVWDYC